ncbi:RNA polymerase II transcription regulator recruiting protein [Aureococcus anophagefferens]|nr:RNA polymerase II transcription regulator recruiting protein [Aureococcus anophagefferens]
MMNALLPGDEDELMHDIAERIPGRIGKQCRERWTNHLDPNLKKGGWTHEEDTILAEAQQRWGNAWTKIAKLLPGRAENAVKNRWNSAFRRKKSAIGGGGDFPDLLGLDDMPGGADDDLDVSFDALDMAGVEPVDLTGTGHRPSASGGEVLKMDGFSPAKGDHGDLFYQAARG